MNKLFEDKMSYFQWQNGMELRYNVMPAWWWNEYMKKKTGILAKVVDMSVKVVKHQQTALIVVN